MTISGPARHDGAIAIVGAGPAGLTLARLLRRKGLTVRVFERDGSVAARRQGGSLDLRPSLGQKAIREAGLWDVFAAHSRDDAKAFRLVDAQGAPIPGAGAGMHEDAGPEIDRCTLRRLLLDAVEPGTVARGHAVTDVHPDAGGRWRLEFEGGAPFTADLVVGADGVGSRVRARLTPVRLVYVGHTMLTADGQRTIVAQRCADDLILVYASMKVAEDWPARERFALADTDAVLGAIGRAYDSWSPNLLAMLTQIDGPVQRWPAALRSTGTGRSRISKRRCARGPRAKPALASTPDGATTASRSISGRARRPSPPRRRAGPGPQPPRARAGGSRGRVPAWASSGAALGQGRQGPAQGPTRPYPR